MLNGNFGKVLMVIFGLFCTGTLLAQVPQSINYQAVARNTETGDELTNRTVFLSVKILADGPQGEIVYQEDHSEVTTNAFGLFTLQIGEGSPVVGQFVEINWSQGNIWLEIDLDLGDGLETIGSMQFVTVPYALFAENVSNVDDADADPNNEKISNISFIEGTNILTVSEAGEEFDVDLTSLKNDADANPQNEIITSLNFNASTTVLSINEGGILKQVTLDLPIDDADSDPENELIDPVNGMVLYGDTMLQITEGGVLNELNLAALIDDADSDPENELINPINGLVLDGDTMLQITEGGVLNEVDLTPLIYDGDWVVDEDENTVYNTTDKIGIGTNSPVSQLEVHGSVGYNWTEIESSGPDYDILPNDHIIICKCYGGTSLDVNLPDPGDFVGRVITVRSVGPTFFGCSINVNTGGFQIDLINQLILFNNTFTSEGITLMSIGSQGWITLSKD